MREAMLSLLRRAETLELSSGARQRLKWFLFWADHDQNASLTCRHFAIARSTFQRWIDRFDPADPLTLEEQSRRPHTVRQPQTDPQVVELIRACRQRYLSREQIQQELQEVHKIDLSVSTIGRVIRRNNMYFREDRKSVV